MTILGRLIHRSESCLLDSYFFDVIFFTRDLGKFILWFWHVNILNTKDFCYIYSVWQLLYLYYIFITFHHFSLFPLWYLWMYTSNIYPPLVMVDLNFAKWNGFYKYLKKIDICRRSFIKNLIFLSLFIWYGVIILKLVFWELKNLLFLVGLFFEVICLFNFLSL